MKFRFLLFLFISTSALLGWVFSWKYQLKLSQQESIDLQAEILEKEITLLMKESQLALFTLVNFLDLNQPEGQFDAIANRLLKKNPWIATFQLAPNGIIRNAYPFIGNEAVVGMDILQDQEQDELMKNAILNKELYMIGPVKLRQGYEAFILRQPVYTKKALWGFVTAIIPKKKLLDELKLARLEESGYLISIQGRCESCTQVFQSKTWDETSSRVYAKREIPVYPLAFELKQAKSVYHHSAFLLFLITVLLIAFSGVILYRKM